MKPQYKVDGRIFDKLADAKKHRKNLKDGLPDDAVIVIFISEEIHDNGEPAVMWVPFA